MDDGSTTKEEFEFDSSFLMGTREKRVRYPFINALIYKFTRVRYTVANTIINRKGVNLIPIRYLHLFFCSTLLKALQGRVPSVKIHIILKLRFLYENISISISFKSNQFYINKMIDAN